MGYEWLRDIEQALAAAGFSVERGYPAKNAVHLIGTVAAVNLTRVDMAERRAVATVTVLAPRKYGLDHCQEMAAKAAQVLSPVGGQWGFSGWKFDSGIDCYYVEVVGTVYFVLQEDVWTVEAGYQVLIEGEAQSHVTDFLAWQQADRDFVRAHGQSEPVGVTPGMGGWTIRLTQLIPTGEPEPVTAEEPFSLTVRRGGHSQVFAGCCWSEHSSQQLEQGTRVIRSGFALSREVS